ncbi:PAQR family membrane homeostasis protein TrhA [Polycladidibacter hongkongensis]|uniref:PAQR family membrane homeostasis protein TrhA n=1 Tax=Polycladidibacter hongkongensis TaxID=1647556 RepID=UPI00083778D3|nr:hemolysin III family protein [Pseudovibrio hongkongensis]
MRQQTRPEIIADGIVHVMGIAFGAAATTALMILLWAQQDAARLTSVVVYAACLNTMLICSALYNLLAKENKVGILRRLDHSAIFLMIAGTYTPLCLMVLKGWIGITLLGVVWTTAIAGAAIKMLHLSKLERFTVPIYLALGWSGFLAIVPLYSQSSALGFGFLVAGGLLYSVGTLFYIAKTLPYQNAIWHGFVLGAAACHFTTIVVDVAIPGMS